MHKGNNNILSQYLGYQKTPMLWDDNKVENLQQFSFPIINSSKNILSEQFFEEEKLHKTRLGKRVEQFVSYDFKNAQGLRVLAENIQIKDEKITIGELDCLLLKNSIPIHLEIVYKFYLYDPELGNTELEHWIGANRKDSLVEKIYKLIDKQLPLLYNENTKSTLARLNLKVGDIQQRVLFKAQLFLPYQSGEIRFNLLNDGCLSGFWIKSSDLNHFKECGFYIPIKKDWLVNIQSEVDWMDYDSFLMKLQLDLQNNYSPLCWFKFPGGNMQKFFVVWW